jgi:hypothetical protein
MLQRLRRAMEFWSDGGLCRKDYRVRQGQAIDYALKRWEAMNWFVDDRVLEIDTNSLENAIRPSALGKTMGCSLGIPKLANATW